MQSDPAFLISEPLPSESLPTSDPTHHGQIYIGPKSARLEQKSDPLLRFGTRIALNRSYGRNNLLAVLIEGFEA